MTTTDPTPATDASEQTTPSPAAASTGGESLPVRPARYVETPMVNDVRLRLHAAVLTGGCTIIDGPVGIGKTTALAQAARELKCNAVYVDMFGTTSTRDVLDTVWRAMTGTPGTGTASAIQRDISETLARTRTVLVIDDTHHVRMQGLITMLAIWDQLHNQRGKGSPIAFCGNDLERFFTKKMRPLLSRCATTYAAAPLAGPTLVQTVLAMEPAIAGTDPETIRNINKRFFRGELRRWDQFFDLLQLFRTNQPTGPLTDDETAQVLSLMTKGAL